MRRRVLPWFAPLAASAALAVAACGSSSPPSDPCPSDLPSSCPSPEPSYANDVAPIVKASCSPCHAPGGIEDKVFDFSTYQGLAASKGEVLSQVYGCEMPPADGGAPLSTADRATLLAWLVCQAPDN